MKVSGFLLLELIVVTALCAGICMMTVSLFLGADRWMASMEVERLVLSVKNARAMALCTGKEYYIPVSLLSEPYVQLGVFDGVYGPPSSPVYPITKYSTFPERGICCYADGAVSAGSVYITNASKTVSYAVTISIDAYGFIRRYYYKPDKALWCLIV